MRRPQDPRQHGLKEPEAVLTADKTISLHEMIGSIYSREVNLSTLINAWNKCLKEIESQGFRIVAGPIVDKNLCIRYTVKWDNLTFEAEKAYFDAQILAYQEALASFKEEALIEKDVTLNLDAKIARAEERLANLKAVKYGLPFQNGKLAGKIPAVKDMSPELRAALDKAAKESAEAVKKINEQLNVPESIMKSKVNM